MIGAADQGQLHLRKLVAQQRPDALGEEPVGGDARKVAERADEQQALTRRFRRRLKALQIHPVFDHYGPRFGPEHGARQELFVSCGWKKAAVEEAFRKAGAVVE